MTTVTHNFITIYTFILDGQIIDQTANEREAMETYKAHPTATVYKMRVDVNAASYREEWIVDIEDEEGEK